MKTFRALVRREFWEHRSLWLTPFLVAALILLGVAVQGEWQSVTAPPPPPGALRGAPPAVFGVLNLEALFFIAAGIVAVAYLMDCLYAERRDRSILFWRSLPVSDRATVLAKFFVATVAVPALFYGVAFGTTALALEWELLRGSSILAWSEWLRLQGVLLYTTVATVLWYAPYAAYLMVVSAWARRSVFAWAVTPPLLVALVERVVFGTTYVGRIVQRGFNELYRLAFRVNQQVNFALGDVLQPMRGSMGGPGGGRGPRPGPELHFDPTELLASPALWLGLAAAALLLAAAIRLRQRDRDA